MVHRRGRQQARNGRELEIHAAVRQDDDSVAFGNRLARALLQILEGARQTQPARLVRPDLTGKIGTGRYGFSFTVPFAYKDAKPHSPSVRVAGSDFFVPFFAVVWPSFECGRE